MINGDLGWIICLVDTCGHLDLDGFHLYEVEMMDGTVTFLK